MRLIRNPRELTSCLSRGISVAFSDCWHPRIWMEFTPTSKTMRSKIFSLRISRPNSNQCRSSHLFGKNQSYPVRPRSKRIDISRLATCSGSELAFLASVINLFSIVNVVDSILTLLRSWLCRRFIFDYWRRWRRYSVCRS